MHKQKLVHRDIKPSNILVGLEEGGAVAAKIIDLGLAKSVDESGSQTAISTPGVFAGTPEFASPEQFAGVRVDIRSDLYSLGVTLWQMVAGKAPFQGSPAEVMYQHQHAPWPVEQLKDVPQPVVVLLEVLLEKDPGAVFRTRPNCHEREGVVRQGFSISLDFDTAGTFQPSAATTGCAFSIKRLSYTAAISRFSPGSRLT